MRQSSGTADYLPVEQAVHTPREIAALVNWLLSNDIERVVCSFFLCVQRDRKDSRMIFQKDQLFAEPGDPALVAQIREVIEMISSLVQIH